MFSLFTDLKLERIIIANSLNNYSITHMSKKTFLRCVLHSLMTSHQWQGGTVSRHRTSFRLIERKVNEYRTAEKICWLKVKIIWCIDNGHLTGLEENEEIYNKEKCPIQPIADRGFLTLKSACSIKFLLASWMLIGCPCPLRAFLRLHMTHFKQNLIIIRNSILYNISLHLSYSMQTFA